MGKWSPMCSLSTYTAVLICKKLGYVEANNLPNQYYVPWIKIDSQESFGASQFKSLFNYLYCSSSYTSLSQCNAYRKSDQCYTTGAHCSTEYGLTCKGPIEMCRTGELRLADGVIEQEGRPEICLDDGVWGSICEYSWDLTDAYIFCKTLGYDGKSPVKYDNSYYGRGLSIPAWNNLNCFGWEDTLEECSKSVNPSIYCWENSDIAGVMCKDKCKDGELRLVGGEYNNEGTVELCYNNLWGQISDVGWSNKDAKVVCYYLGYKNGVPTAMYSSHYGKSNKTIHASNVQCSGSEHSIRECHKTQYSVNSGKQLLKTVSVAGVDCIYDEPTPPSCIVNPVVDPSDSCSIKGSIRLMKDGVQSTSEGRVEYCNGTYWSPLCTMDNKAATVVCKQSGYTQYHWGKIFENGEFGSLLNYSLIQKISCTGSENSLSQCTVVEPTDSCLPWCPDRNIGLKCFANNKRCEDGSIRLVEGIIEQGGRVEVCLNGVWGSVCDDGWDTTDGHVVCKQMGFADLKPYVFSNSHFGDGQYPIVYSNVNCGGWEDSLMDCHHTIVPEFSCSRENTAGVLCGYDCADGDVRLVQGPSANEGTVEVCFSNLWGLIENSLWSLNDAKVVCTQLGYGAEGTDFSSGYGKPNKTVHLTNVQCTGSEVSIKDCTQETYSLEEGMSKLGTVDVAGVKCYVPSECDSPPDGGSDCINGSIRLSESNNREGTLEYCYKGLWSPFCSLNETEAIVACRQLGYNKSNFVSIFTDGRYSSKQFFTSFFKHITCSSDKAISLHQCTISDSCQTTCQRAIGIKCFEPQDCNNGDIRLKDGTVAKEGRIEVCYNKIWGSVCGEGFDFTDAYVACKAISISEPTVYTDSEFGDGNVPIIYSNLECKGYEESLNECNKKNYGNFSCSRKKVAGIKCQDDCISGKVRLIGGQRDTEGTVEVCYDKVWGLISSNDWDDNDASVVCSQIGYLRDGAVAVIDSSYGKPNRTIHLGNVRCTGSEENIGSCENTKIPEEVGRHLHKFIQVAGVSCLRVKPVTNTVSNASAIKTKSTVTVVKTEFMNTCTASDVTCNIESTTAIAKTEFINTCTISDINSKTESIVTVVKTEFMNTCTASDITCNIESTTVIAKTEFINTCTLSDIDSKTESTVTVVKTEYTCTLSDITESTSEIVKTKYIHTCTTSDITCNTESTGAIAKTEYINTCTVSDTVVKTEYINTCTVSDINFVVKTEYVFTASDFTCKTKTTAAIAMSAGKSTATVVKTESTELTASDKRETKSTVLIQSSVVQVANPPGANTGNQESPILLVAFVSVLLLLAMAVVVILIMFFKSKNKQQRASVISNRSKISSLITEQGVINPTTGTTSNTELKERMTIGENQDNLPDQA